MFFYYLLYVIKILILTLIGDFCAKFLNISALYCNNKNFLAKKSSLDCRESSESDIHSEVSSEYGKAAEVLRCAPNLDEKISVI